MKNKRDYLLNSLNEFEKLEKNWDGYDALPISKKAIEKMRYFVNNFSDIIILDRFILFADVDTSMYLSLQYDKKVGTYAGINIYDDHLTYFILSNGELQGDDNIAFNGNKDLEDVCKKIIKNI